MKHIWHALRDAQQAPSDRAEVRRTKEDEERGCSDSHADGWIEREDDEERM